MGNRAFLYPETAKPGQRVLGVYLHWNGGPDSVIPLIRYCKMKKYRPFSDGYGVARLAQVMGNFFNGTTSLGVEFEKPECVDTNHTPYCITDNWEIKNINDYKDDDWPDEQHIREFLVELNNSQPKEDRLPEVFMFEDRPDPATVKPGSKIIWHDEIWHKFKKATVYLNASDKPAIRRYGNWKNNINCELENTDFRLIK